MMLVPSVCTPGCAVSVEKALVEPWDRVVDRDRKIGQLQAAFGFRDVGGVRLHHGDRFDGHGGGLRRNFQVQVDVLGFSGAQFEGLKFGLLKSGGVDGKLIGSDVDIDELVSAVGVRFGLASGVRAGVNEFDFGLGE